jgi:hypothetical protein
VPHSFTKSDLNLNGGPLSFFQAVEFSEDDFRKLQKTINNSKLAEEDLRERFDAWWSGLNERIKKIDATSQPAVHKLKADELLGEILGLTRTIVRELQAPRPLQVFAPTREMEAFARALMKPQPGLGADPTGDKARAEMAGVAAAIADSLTLKSE